MRLKKFLALMLVGCLTFSLVACGGDKAADKDSNVADSSENNDDSKEDESSSENESTSEKEPETKDKTPITEEDAMSAAQTFMEKLMGGDVDAAKTYFPYEMTDDDWAAATSALSAVEAMYGMEMDVTDGIKAKMYFKLVFTASDATKMSDDSMSELKNTIEDSDMGEKATYDVKALTSGYNVPVIMSMDMWVDDWTIDSAVVSLTDDEIEQMKTMTNDALKQQSEQYSMGFSVCVGDIDSEAKVIIFEAISEE